jgi:ribonuclease Z
LSGREVSSEQRIPRIAYLGDSTIQGLDNNPLMYQADILIVEVTFIAPGHRSHKIQKLGHIHIDDIIERRTRFENQLIIAAHLSSRYHAEQVERLVDRTIPDRLDGRLLMWM